MVLSTKTPEQASMMNAFAKAGDLQKRILFTIIALVVFRFGTHIPLPGINPDVIKGILANSAMSNLLGMFDTFAGGALARMTILALNIMPYISASIVVQLAASIFEPLKALRKEGESGHNKMNQYTRYLTILITIIQGYGLAVALENMGDGSAVIMTSTVLFRISTVVSLLGGTLFVMWLGEQITQRGIGNGTSLIITVGIIAEMPRALFSTFELGRSGELSQAVILALLAMTFALIWVVVFVERAQRRIVIQYPKGMMSNRLLNTKNSYFPLKINPTGVMPPIFASALLMLPLTLIKFLSNTQGAEGGWAQNFEIWMNRGTTAYLAVYALLIIFFTFFYTGVVFNPKETADNLKRNGGFIAGIRPGEATAKYLDYVMTRLTVLGSIYLAGLCVVPELLISKLSVPFVLGGTTLLIVVTVIMETISQVQSHLIAYQYESLIRKAKLKGRL
ncbi:MAG: preprotein translocase subunit SecY [Alphaproteobacteria bacterium]